MRSLREYAGLGTKELASRTGLSEGYLRATERSSECKLKRSTAMAIFDAINSAKRVPRSSTDEYFAMAGLDALSEIMEATPGPLRELLDRMKPIGRLLREVPPDEASVYEACARLISETSPATSLTLVNAILNSIRDAKRATERAIATDQDDRILIHRSGPRREEDLIVEEFSGTPIPTTRPPPSRRKQRGA